MPDNGLPDGWTRARLGDYLTLCRNGVVCRQDGDVVDGVPVSRIETISNGVIDWTRVGYAPPDDVDLDYLLQRGDVLLSHINSVAHIGKVARYESDRPLLHGMNLMLLRLSPAMDSNFGWQYLLWSKTKGYFERRAKKAVNQASINQQDIRDLGLFVPPLDEQLRIAEVLDSIDAAIEKTEAVIAATERLRSALLGELLTRGVPGWHTEWKQVPGIGTIPACWEVVRLGDVVTFVGSGVTPRGGREVYTTTGVLFIRSQNVHFAGLRLDDCVCITLDVDAAMKRSRVQPGDVLLNITGASIGRCTVVPQGFGPANVNQHVCILRLVAAMNPAFVSEWLGTQRSQREIDDLQAGQSRQGLNYEQVRLLTCIKPPREEQDRMIQLLSGVRQRIAEEHRALNQLERLKTATADALLSGRVRVREKRGEQNG